MGDCGERVCRGQFLTGASPPLLVQLSRAQPFPDLTLYKPPTVMVIFFSQTVLLRPLQKSTRNLTEEW